ncbi:MAG TPA: porin [Caulobacteraceae bacterium]
MSRNVVALGVAISAWGLAGVALAQQTAPAPDERDARIDRLENEVRALVDANRSEAVQIAALTAQIADLKTSREPAQQAQVETLPAPPPRGPPAAIASLADGKPVIATPDGRFSLTVHGIAQLDAAAYDQASAGPIATDLRRSGPALGASASNVDLSHARQLRDGDVFRRARIGIDGTAFGDFDYRLIFDFGGTGVENAGQVYETWIQYSGFHPAKLRVGAFPPSIGLEDQGSTSTMPLLERSAVSDIARGFVAGDTRTAVEAFANGPHWLISGAVTGRTIGVINTGTAAATPQTFGDQLGLVGRLAATPLHGDDWLVHFGVHGSYLVTPPDASGPPTAGASPLSREVVAFADTPELRVDGTKLINTGNISARHADEEGLEFAAQKGSLFLQSEYEHFDVDRATPGVSNPRFHGWYVEGSWIVTGESRKYNTQTAAFDGPAVPHPFSPRDGGWGAWEVALRYADTDLNYDAGAPGTAAAADAIRGGELKVISAGINWYLNPIMRIMLDFQHVMLDRLSPNGTLYSTPTGAQIGQDYNVVSVRSQVAF